jgi:nicotinamidase/pyrazinamidase
VKAYLAAGDIVVYTKDHHPQDHHSFEANHPDGIWPDHCVQGTTGWEFHSDLDVQGPIFYKAFETEEDSYSGFGGFIESDPMSTSLEQYLHEQGVVEVTVVGLALDYCVKSTAIDARKLGFQAKVLLEATRAVNVKPGDGQLAVDELRELGVQVL